MGNRRVHQILNAFAVDGAHRKYFLETELGEFVHAFFSARRIHLVDGDEDGLAAFAQALRHFAVKRHDAFLDIDDEDDRIRRFDGHADLLHGGLDDDIAGFLAAQQTDAAGVHERVGPALPFGLDAHAVARDARLVMHNRDAFFDDAIEQRGFAHIRAADDGDKS
jgi:hypothetical protein